MDKYHIGTEHAANQLIADLYLDLRKKVREWAQITEQTDQARMGYVGQHLVSVVTGFKGGKSGARGKDLKLGGEKYGEIKTCYRVDQLGKCGECNHPAGGSEKVCRQCGSPKLLRLDDSKWLIGLRNDAEFDRLLDPTAYFLVLFEYADLAALDLTIIASIWRVDPKAPGFALCMIDYYQNIRSASKSKAPFNLWPHSLKFELMRPRLIYRALIPEGEAPKISTVVFPDKNEQDHPLFSTSRPVSATTVTLKHLNELADTLKIPANARGYSKGTLVQALEKARASGRVSNTRLCDRLAMEIYFPAIDAGRLPRSLASYVTALSAST